MREVVGVDIPRPRDIFTIQTQPEFRSIYDRVWEHLGEEMKQSEL